MLALVIGVIAGIASTVQASVNTEARRFFRSPFITAGLNFIVAWLCLAAFIVFNEHALSVPVHEIAKNPPWIWLGGVCAIIIVTLNILCVPKLGAAGNVMILNFGQIVTGLVIDHFALFGADEARMTFTRLLGAVMVFAGLILVTHEKSAKNEKQGSFPMFYAVLAFIDGIASEAGSRRRSGQGRADRSLRLHIHTDEISDNEPGRTAGGCGFHQVNCFDRISKCGW